MMDPGTMSDAQLLRAMLGYQQEADAARTSDARIPLLEARDACYAEALRRLAAARPAGDRSALQDRAEEALRPYITNPASRHLAAADAVNAVFTPAPEPEGGA